MLATAQALLVWLLSATWKLVHLSPTYQATGMDQCCQNAFHHQAQATSKSFNLLFIFSPYTCSNPFT